jgi:poly-gamma-glutamate synthesis protein (capsule biosynthesis protein)
MDWGREGLAETMASLKQAGIRFAGAGANLAAAEEPAVLQVEGMAGRVLFLAMATRDARVPAGWEATQAQSGINLIELDNQHLQRIASVVRRHRRTGDFVIASIHWGDNLSPRLEPETRRFAHLLIDRAGIDLIHGHSAHHVREIEVYRGKLILYGCGDLLNDYEGIDPYRGMRPYLGLVCLADIDPPSGRLRALNMIPTRVKRLRINRAGAEDTRWLLNTLNRRTAPLGLRVTARNGFLRLYGVGPA